MRIDTISFGTASVNNEARHISTTSVEPATGLTRVATTSTSSGSSAGVFASFGAISQGVLLSGGTVGTKIHGTTFTASIGGCGTNNYISISTQPVQSNSASLFSFGEICYGDVSDTLASLTGDSAPDDWRINADVYSTSLQVAAVLSENFIPAPSVFSNDTDSVVFNWNQNDAALYLTITKDQLYLMFSDREQIRYRGELQDSEGQLGFVDLVAGLKHEPLLLPGKIAA